MNVLIEKTEVVQDELHVETRKSYKNLKYDIKSQRDENEIAYKELKNIIKQTESQRNKIGIFNTKIEELEQHVGILSNSKDPYWNQYPGNETTNAQGGDEGDEAPQNNSHLGTITQSKENAKITKDGAHSGAQPKFQLNDKNAINSDQNLRIGNQASSMGQFIQQTAEAPINQIQSNNALIGGVPNANINNEAMGGDQDDTGNYNADLNVENHQQTI